MTNTFIVYYTNWSIYDRNFQPSEIPSNYIPEIAYSFFNVDKQDNKWSIVSIDQYADFDKVYTQGQEINGIIGELKKIKNTNKNIKLSLAIGGWSLSKNFSLAMKTEQGRIELIDSIRLFFSKYSFFTGLIIDWEYLSGDGIDHGNGNNVDINDVNNFNLFLTSFKKIFPNITIALCTSGSNNLYFDPKIIEKNIDEFHLMTYDFHSSSWGETITCHNANPRKSMYGPFSCEEGIDTYINAGVPSNKILIGGAFYSRGFANTDGLGKSASGIVSDMSWEAGVCDYNSLPRSGAVEYFDNEAKACYSYDPVRKIFNSYDNPTSIIEKCKIIKEKNIKGIICWEMSGDYPIDNNRSLIKTLYNNLVNHVPVVNNPVPVVNNPVPVVNNPVPVVNNPVNNLQGYTFYQGQDIWEGTITQAQTRDINELANICNNTMGAVAFNTNGFIKNIRSPLGSWKGPNLDWPDAGINEGTYIKNNNTVVITPPVITNQVPKQNFSDLLKLISNFDLSTNNDIINGSITINNIEYEFSFNLSDVIINKN